MISVLRRCETVILSSWIEPGWVWSGVMRRDGWSLVTTGDTWDWSWAHLTQRTGHRTCLLTPTLNWSHPLNTEHAPHNICHQHHQLNIFLRMSETDQDLWKLNYDERDEDLCIYIREQSKLCFNVDVSWLVGQACDVLEEREEPLPDMINRSDDPEAEPRCTTCHGTVQNLWKFVGMRPKLRICMVIW